MHEGSARAGINVIGGGELALGATSFGGEVETQELMTDHARRSLACMMMLTSLTT